MKESTRNWVQYAITTLLGVAWAAFDRRAELVPIVSDAWPSISWFVVPAGYVAIGFSFGWVTCRLFRSKAIERPSALHAEEVAELNERHAAEVAEKDAEIARLKSDRDTAGQQTAEPSLDAIMSLSQLAAAGVLDAMERLDAGEKYVKFGDRIEDSLWLIRNSNGMIERHVTYFNGYHSRRDEYFVVPEWAAFLSIPENRKALERMAFCSRWPN